MTPVFVDYFVTFIALAWEQVLRRHEHGLPPLARFSFPAHIMLAFYTVRLILFPLSVTRLYQNSPL